MFGARAVVLTLQVGPFSLSWGLLVLGGAARFTSKNGPDFHFSEVASQLSGVILISLRCPAEPNSP